MPKPTHHILVCTQTRPADHPRGSCSDRNSKDLLMRFFMESARLQLVPQVVVTESSCMGPCDHGPTVVVYPDAVWYGKVKADDVAEILEQHIKGGKPVERLLLPDEVWG